MCKVSMQAVNFNLGEHLPFACEPYLKRALPTLYGCCLSHRRKTKNRLLLNSVQFLAVNG